MMVIGGGVVVLLGGLVFAGRDESRARPGIVETAAIRSVVVPDLIGGPVAAAQAVVDGVEGAVLSVGGAGTVIVFQSPPPGGRLTGEKPLLSVTLGDSGSLAAARAPLGPEAARLVQDASASYPTPTAPQAVQIVGSESRPAPAGAPTEYGALRVVVTYRSRPSTDDSWTWKLIDTRTATVAGVFPVRPGDGCGGADRQVLAAKLAKPARPDDGFTVRLDRRVGSHEEQQAATTMTAASSYRGLGVVLFENAGRLATSPTGDATC